MTAETVGSLQPQADWPQSWHTSFPFDQLEIYGSTRDPGYSSAYAVRRELILDLIGRVAAPGARVLDIAGAQGNFSIALARAGFSVTWNDIREDLIGYIKLKYGGENIDFRPGNLFELDSRPQYDVVLAAEVIEHVAHPDAFLAAAAALVRPGGHIVLTTPNGRYFRNRLPRFSDCEDFTEFEKTQFAPDADGHIFLLHPDEIHALGRRAGLDIVELQLYANPLTWGFLGTKSLLRLLPRSTVTRIEALTSSLPSAISERINTSAAVLLRKR